MRTSKVLPLLVVAGLIGCQDQPTGPDPELGLAASASSLVNQVTGSGTVVREDIEGAPREVYGFRAVVDGAGNARGEAEVHFPSDDVKMHIDVQCLVVERNRAWLSGPVTRSDDPDTPPGRVFLWLVQDNGEGQGAPPDRISNFLHRPWDNYPPDICEEKWALQTFPWDNGSVRISTPGAIGLWDAVGTWDVTTFVCTNLADPAESQSLISSDSRIRQTVAPNGRLTLVFWTPGPPTEIWENTSGWMEVEDGVARVFNDEAPMILQFPLDIQGNVWRAEFEGNVCQWDDDDEEDPSHVIMELRRKRTGVLIDDVAGRWVATAWRYTSVASPGTSVDLVADQGLSITMTVMLDSRFYLTMEPGGWTSTTDDLLLEGDRMLTRNGDASSVVFTLKKGVWSFTGLQEYDFGTGGEPATLEAVLARP